MMIYSSLGKSLLSNLPDRPEKVPFLGRTPIPHWDFIIGFPEIML
jgi:hypothetical protein